MASWQAEADGHRYLVIPSASPNWWAAGEKVGRRSRVIGSYRTAAAAKRACEAQTPLVLRWERLEATEAHERH